MVSSKQQLKYVLAAIAAIEAKAKGVLQTAVDVHVNTNGNTVGEVEGPGYRCLMEDAEKGKVDSTKRGSEVQYDYGGAAVADAVSLDALVSGEQAALAAVHAAVDTTLEVMAESDWTIEKANASMDTVIQKNEDHLVALKKLVIWHELQYKEALKAYDEGDDRVGQFKVNLDEARDNEDRYTM